MLNLKKVYSLFAALSLVMMELLFAGCDAEKPAEADKKPLKIIKIAYLPITHALPLFAERELETPEGPIKVELIKYGSWPELMDALNTGKVDGASVLIELAVKAREQGIDVKAAALGHKDGNAIIVSPDIHLVEDLRGTTIAIPHKQSTHKLLLDQLLADHGMTEQDVNVVELSPPEMPSALAQGQIAGDCVAEPFGAKSVLLQTGKVLARTEDLWPDSLCCALVFNGDYLIKNHDTAELFVNNYQKAGNYLTEHMDEQKRIAKKYLKAKDDVIDLSLQWISYKDLRISRAAYDDLCKRMVAANLLQDIPAYDEFVDSSLLK